MLSSIIQDLVDALSGAYKVGFLFRCAKELNFPRIADILCILVEVTGVPYRSENGFIVGERAMSSVQFLLNFTKSLPLPSYYETTAPIRGRRVDRYAGTFFICWGDETLNMIVT